MRSVFKSDHRKYESDCRDLERGSSQCRDLERGSSQCRDLERGSIEAGLTFIPTTAFFLLVLQLVISGGFQVVEKISLQNVITRAALGDSKATELFASNKRGVSVETVPLPGGGELILARSEISSPRITNFLSNNPRMKAEAIAVRE